MPSRTRCLSRNDSEDLAGQVRWEAGLGVFEGWVSVGVVQAFRARLRADVSSRCQRWAVSEFGTRLCEAWNAPG